MEKCCTMNNAVYSKTMESLRNRIDVKLVSNKKGYLKWTSKPNYMSHKIFENDLVTICVSKVITLNKAAYTGMRILELSKILMYKFHYDYIKNKCGNNLRLLFIEIDSLMCEFKTEDVFEDFSKGKKIFDFSSCSAKSKYDDSNKLVVVKMKDGTAGVVIEKFVGLKSQRCIPFW